MDAIHRVRNPAFFEAAHNAVLLAQSDDGRRGYRRLAERPLRWERIWERNTAERPRWRGMRRDGLDGREVVTWRFETGEATGDGDWFAHNPEVAGSNPVPATKEGALTRPNGRRHQLAAGSFCERCEQRRSASVILTPSTTAMDAAIAGF